MYAGPLAERPVTASMCFSSTTTVRPTTSNILQVMATWAASAYWPLHTAVIPLPTKQGVLGMARITGTFGGKFFSIKDVGTEAATEMINCRGVISPRISVM